jgi:hypothetical protein
LLSQFCLDVKRKVLQRRQPKNLFFYKYWLKAQLALKKEKNNWIPKKQQPNKFKICFQMKRKISSVFTKELEIQMQN